MNPPLHGRRAATRVAAALALLVATGLTLVTARADTRIEGQTFAARQSLSGSELTLNGVGLRAVSWLKAYAAALYLPQKTRSAADALSMRGAKRVQLRMLLDAPAQEFVKALDRGVARNTSEQEFTALKERLAQLTRAVAAVGQVRKGDVIDLDYRPGSGAGSGIAFSHNGRALLAPVAGDDLYPALLKIFIGEQAVDPELKDGLLGGPAR